MKNPLSIAVIVLILLSACSARTTSFTDMDSKANISRMSGNRLAGGITTVELNAQRFDKSGTPSFSLIILYSGPTFVNIGPGKTLILLIDGQRLEIAGQGSEKSRNIVSIGLIEEKAYYHDLDPDLIRMLAYAKEVEVEIIGASKVLNRHFKEQNFVNFKEFYELYVIRRAGS